MTAEELSSIYYINLEIAKIEEELYNLRNHKNFYKKSVFSDMPRGGQTRDMMTEYVGEVRALESMLAYSLRKLQEERRKMEEFLNTIKDAELRLIMRLRAVNNMKWEEIGMEIGMDRRTAARKFYGYFKGCPQCP